MHNLYELCMQSAYSMPAEEDRVRVNGRVPQELYADICKYYANITTAINDAFELLRQEKMGQLHKDCGNNMQNDASSIQAQLDATRMQLDAANMQIDFLKDQLKIKDGQQEARINDLLDQLKVKDQQLEKKDSNYHDYVILDSYSNSCHRFHCKHNIWRMRSMMMLYLVM